MLASLLSARRAMRRALPLLALAGLLLPLATPTRTAEAGAPPFSGTKYRDKNWKFSLMTFKGWEPIPLEVGEKIEVCKLTDPKGKGQNRGTLDPSLTVVRVAKEGAAEGAVTPGEGDPKPPPGIPPELLERMRGMSAPKDAFDAMVAQLIVDEKFAWPKKDFKAIESRDGVPGKVWAFEAPHQYYSGPDVPKSERLSYFLVLATFEKDKVEYGIRMMCGHALRKDFEAAFVKVAKSFMVFDDKAEDVAALPVLDGVNITPKRRHDIEKSMVRGWDVIVSPKKQYIVIYNTKRGENHALAKLIAERIEAIRAQLYEVQFPPAKPITAVSICRVCKDAQDYHAYGGPGGSAGYWNSGSEELVFYDASEAKKADADTLAVLYHEAFHQFIYYSVGEVAPHSWFNEGHGDYYAGAKYAAGKFKIEPFAWRVGTVRNAIVEGPRSRNEVTGAKPGESSIAWGNKGYTPLKDLVAFSQGDYYSYPGVSYAQGWSLVYFLREVVPANKKYAEKWGHILETYFRVLKAAVNEPPPAMGGGRSDPGAAPGAGGDGGDGAKPGDEPPAPPGGLDPGDLDPTPPPSVPDGDPAPTPPPGGAPPAPPGGPPAPPGDGGETPGMEIPMTNFRWRGGEEALQKALAEAFKGIDWDEFEDAWKKATKSGK